MSLYISKKIDRSKPTASTPKTQLSDTLNRLIDWSEAPSILTNEGKELKITALSEDQARPQSINTHNSSPASKKQEECSAPGNLRQGTAENRAGDDWSSIREPSHLLLINLPRSLALQGEKKKNKNLPLISSDRVADRVTLYRIILM